MNLQCRDPEKSSSILSSFVSRRCRDPGSTHSPQLDQLARIYNPVPPDALLLYWTVVSDKAVLSGYEMEFAALETSIRKASDSARRLSTRMNNMTSAVWLHQREEMLNSSSRLKKLSGDQFLLAAQSRPTRFRAKWQRSFYDGPNARRDAEEALRSKWVETLASLLRGTSTPMGELLSKGADNHRLLGRGRRATTLRARGRTVKKYLAWLALAHEETSSIRGTPCVGIPPDETLRTLYSRRIEEHSSSIGVHGGYRGSGNETHASSTLQHPLQGAPVEHPHKREPETGTADPDSHGPSARRHSH